MRRFVLVLAVVALAVPMMPTMAQDAGIDDRASRIVSELTGCRALANPTERLACFDRTAAALVAAQDSKSIVVVDRAADKKKRRALFGFPGRSVDVFDKSPAAAPPEIQDVTAKLVRTALAGHGLFTLTLDDGSVWRMSESLGRLPPDIGDVVKVVRGALGSYRASIAGGRYVEVRRVR